MAIIKSPRGIVTLLAILAIPVGIFLMVDAADDSGGGGTGSQPASREPYAGEVRDGRSFGEVLAAEQTGNLNPREDLVHRFNNLLDGIAKRCSRSREWVSDRVLSGHQMLTRRGGEASLVDVAEGWHEGIGGAGVSDCQGTLAALLLMLEKEVTPD